MRKRSKFRPNLDHFGVQRQDPGWIYLVENADLFKFGRTKNPIRRLQKEVKTWLPNIRVIGIKPFWNVGCVERSIHTGLSSIWYSGEWYKIEDLDDYELIVDGFSEFDNDDRDVNSVDYIYWMNSTGLSEFCIEKSIQGLTLARFQKQESGVKKQA